MSHRLFAVLVVLIFAISLNKGDKVNDRRIAGLVPYPRIGRNNEMTNFPRFDRASGLLHYPRVGRSDPPATSYNRYHDPELDGNIDFYAAHDVDLDALDKDYAGFYLGKPIFLRGVDRVSKENLLPIFEHLHDVREFRPVQKSDDPRLIYTGLAGSRSPEGQVTIGGYTPRLGRESDRDVTNVL